MLVTQIVKELPARNLDPLEVYSLFRGENTYLLESAEGGEKIARYSFIGFNPSIILKIRSKKVDLNVMDPNLAGIHPRGNDPLEILRNLINEFEYDKCVKIRFSGGIVGYFSYDLVRYAIHLEDIPDELNDRDCEFILTKNNIIFDHKAKKVYLTSNLFPGDEKSEELKKLVQIEEKILGDSPGSNAQKTNSMKTNLKFVSNLTKKEFEDRVKIAKEYIVAGDIIQVVLSQRLTTKFGGDAFEVYKTLKQINPSPYMYFLDFEDRKVVGSSPEMLVRVDNKKVRTYPIAGTRPRGKTEKEDYRLENEMLNDEKERAEHIMLVDLGRNDVGRVAKFGTVKVKKLMEVEKYSHVQHMVSEVVGELRDDKDEFDALKSIFPAGTVSGAPKVRAMEIINELEPSRRGIYSGCVGYFSFDHNIDTAITIRTLVFDGTSAHAQAGAGIVADSVPENEYYESISKAKAMLDALNLSVA